MKKILSTLLAIFFFSNIIAQKTCSIQNATAFYTVHLPGMQPVDENGQPRKIKPFINRTIFISSNCNAMPVVSKIIFDGLVAKFVIEKASELDIVSLEDVNKKRIYLNNKKGTFIWKITIKDDGILLPQQPKRVSLLVKWKSKTTITTIQKWTELYSIPSY